MQVTATIGRTCRLGAGIATAALMMTLAACGGGGGSGGSTSSTAPPASIAPIPPTNPPPDDPPPTNPPPTNPPPTTSGTAELTWTSPTQNEDGTPLTNLAGYKIRYGQALGALSQVRDIANPATISVTIEGLSSGTWYFTLASYTNAGVESAPIEPRESVSGLPLGDAGRDGASRPYSPVAGR